DGPGGGRELSVYWPVYVGGGVPATAERRRDDARGVVGASFRLAALLESAIQDSPGATEPIGYTARGPDDAAPVEAARFRPADRKIALGPWSAAATSGGATVVTRQFSTLGLEWTLHTAFGADVVDALRLRTAWFRLFGGTLFTCIVSFVVLRQRQRTIAAGKVVGRQSLELTRTGDVLQQEARDRLETQSRYQQAADELRAIIDASPFTIAALDLERRVIVWSAAGERIFGYSADEIIGQPYPLVPPE